MEDRGVRQPISPAEKKTMNPTPAKREKKSTQFRSCYTKGALVYTAAVLETGREKRPMLPRVARHGSCRTSARIQANAAAATRSSTCASFAIPRAMWRSPKHQHRHHGFFVPNMCPTSSSHVPWWSIKVEPTTAHMGQVRRASTTSTSTSSSRHALLLPRSRGTADDCYILSGSSRRLRPTSTAALLLRYSTAKRFRLSDGTYARCTNESWSCQQGGGGAPARSFVRAFGGQSVVPWELALFLVEEVGVVCSCCAAAVLGLKMNM